MKIFNKFTYALMALSLVAVSCVQEETFKPGEEEDANCYGVFFPKQDASGFHEWDPADPTEIVVKVSRKVATDAISVPVDVVTSDSIWVCPQTIEFDAGQTDTSIVIKFDDAQMGVKYDGLTIEINDPKFASKYSANASFFNFSVQKVKWNTLEGLAVWHDGFMRDLYDLPYAQDIEVEVQERDDVKGLFRFKSVYGADFDFNDPGDYEEGDFWILIDASDSSAVDIAYQYIGLAWGEGPVYIGSTYQFYKQYKGYTDEQMEASYPISEMLGTYDKVNNVISFPAGAAGVALPGFGNPLEGYWWDANDFYVIMPGGKLVDYSISLTPCETEEIEGENWAPIEIITGADVDSIKYTVLQGALTQSQFDDEAAAIIRGDAEGINAVKANPEEGVVVFYTDTTTATYTIVAVAFDAKGGAQQYDRAEFGFVKQGDEIPVSAAFSAASIPGYTEDNEVVINVFGRDITDVKIDYAEYATMMASEDAYDKALASVYEAESLDAEALEAVNGNGYTATMDGLLPGTKYVFMAYVFNGFKSDILLSVVTTSGEPKKIYQSWDEPDETLMADVKLRGAEAYYGEYNYYAKRSGYYGEGDDEYYDDILRAYVGKVKIEDADPELYPTEGPDEDNLYDDYVMVTGIMAPFAAYWEVQDSLIFDVYDGFLYNAGSTVGEYQGYSVKFKDFDSVTGGFGSYGSVMAFVEEGYLAYFSMSMSADYNGYSYILYDGTEPAGYSYSLIVDPLLVDPEVDEETPEPAPAPTAASSASRKVFKPIEKYSRVNYVESEKGLMKSSIDKMKAARKAAKVSHSNITPVNDIVVPAQRAKGQTRVGIASEHNYSASASSSSFDKKVSSAPKVRR